jgi:hypothetical protein
MNPDTNTSNRPDPKTPSCRKTRKQRSIAALLIGLMSSLGGFAMSPNQAHAYTNTMTPYAAGYTKFGYTGGQIVATAGYNFTTPVLIVYRNGAINAGYQQEVTVAYELQRSAGGSAWSTVAAFTERAYIGLGADGNIAIQPKTLRSPIAGSALFRVRTSILWGNASANPYWTGGFTGGQQWVPSYAGDMRCAHALCSAPYAGSLWVSG